MSTEKQFVEPLEDIVFENRNKAYGSYVLRKKYRKYLTISSAIGLLIMSVSLPTP